MLKQKKTSYYLINIVEKLFGLRLFTLEELEKIMLTSLNGVTEASDYTMHFNSKYYQYLHDNNPLFNQNNWLLDELEEIIEKKPTIISELGCGNGLFSAKVAGRCSSVYAIDWAESSGAKGFPENVTFLKKDIVSDDIPPADLVCSGDFLEHLPTSELERTILKVVNCAPFGYHKIACYDDGHSHLSVLPPWRWLLYFQEADPRYKIKKIKLRRNNVDQIIVVISNY